MRPFAFIIFLFCCASADAQLTKIFFDKNHKALKDKDSSKASTYILKEKLADTGWYVKEYRNDGFILSEGMYRDEKMKIPQGKFTYYWVALKKEPLTNPYYSYVEIVGYYSNGLKTGTWIRYNDKGEKSEVSNYINGKMNGLYQQYTFPGHLYVDGNYQDDKRGGEWHVYNKYGKVIVTDTYSAGQVINTVRANPDSIPTVSGPELMVTSVKVVAADRKTGTTTVDLSGGIGEIINAYPDCDFNKLLLKKIENAVDKSTDGWILLHFFVLNNGETTPVSLMKGLDNDTNDLLKNVVPVLCTWHPGQQNGKNIDQAIYCTIRIRSGQITAKYSYNLNDATQN